MPEIVGAIVGALAVIGIPLAAWFSRRATREGRLMLRVERLGRAYTLMPDSDEKDIFKAHVTQAISRLNSWLDPDNKKGRRIVRRVSGLAYVIGILVVLIAVPLSNPVKTPWFTSTLGVILGFAIALITLGTSWLVERSNRMKREKVKAEHDKAAAALRMNAIRRGETPIG